MSESVADLGVKQLPGLAVERPAYDGPAIELVNLVKAFGEQAVLRDLNLQIRRGEIFIVMGLSGTGKSVLLKHLIRLLRPTSGQILVEGRDLGALSEADSRAYLKRVGIVFQHAALFDSMSTGENIAFPMREHTSLDEGGIRSRVEALMAKVRLQGVYDKNPSELSGGMRKRAGIARSLALAPDFVYFDEPTSGLDMVTGTVIENLILETHQDFGYTGVVITHHWELARRLADRVALLWDGSVRALGSPDEIAASDDPVVQGFLNRDPRVLAE